MRSGRTSCPCAPVADGHAASFQCGWGQPHTSGHQEISAAQCPSSRRTVEVSGGEAAEGAEAAVAGGEEGEGGEGGEAAASNAVVDGADQEAEAPGVHPFQPRAWIGRCSFRIHWVLRPAFSDFISGLCAAEVKARGCLPMFKKKPKESAPVDTDAAPVEPAAPVDPDSIQ